jgi:1,4-alpha-glucan branching enzyme
MAVKKTPLANGRWRVTFQLPEVAAGETVQVCGEFNDWSEDGLVLARRKDGRFSATVTLDGGRRYRYRYLVDGERWENDWEADDYVPNDFGGDDSVIDLR